MFLLSKNCSLCLSAAQYLPQGLRPVAPAEMWEKIAAALDFSANLLLMVLCFRRGRRINAILQALLCLMR